MISKGKIKRIIAGLMIPVMSLMIPGVHVTGASKTSKQYIQEITEEDESDNATAASPSAADSDASVAETAVVVATALVSGSFIWIALIVLIGCGTVTAITVSRRHRKNERKQ